MPWGLFSAAILELVDGFINFIAFFVGTSCPYPKIGFSSANVSAWEVCGHQNIQEHENHNLQGNKQGQSCHRDQGRCRSP
ncbi:hypothetical protein B0H16DRAFT_1526668, partial [Mycena metata]